MPTITLESSERSKKKNRTRSNLRAYGTRHGDQFWEEEKQRKNFGLKYMNKFGWSKGDGLGRNKQGNINHVKTKYKNDNRGIGCKTTPNDTMFQATMCMFNDILSGLNKKKDNQSKKEPSIAKYASTSALIKSYEAKHHLYGKFRAAKGISTRSEQEKRELFGDVEVGFTENDQENYALKMNEIASLRSGRMGLGFGGNNDNGFNNTLTFGKFTRSGIITRDDLLDSDESLKLKVKKRKKDKKKRKKKKKIETEKCEKNNQIETENSEGKIVDKKSKKKKKKKNKKRKLEIDEADILMQPVVKKLKLDTDIIKGNVSDLSSIASIFSSLPTPTQSDIDVGNDDENEKKRKSKKKSKKKKNKDKSVKKDKKKKKKKKRKNKDVIVTE